jgi:hypothetical protein
MTSFVRAQRGGQTRYDQDNRRRQRGGLTYTTEPFARQTLVAGPPPQPPRDRAVFGAYSPT